jgi:hypothetical protein
MYGILLLFCCSTFKSSIVVSFEAKGTSSWHKHAAEGQAADAEVQQKLHEWTSHSSQRQHD